MKSITIQKYILISVILIIFTALIVEQYKTNQFKDSLIYYQKTGIANGEKLTTLIKLVENNEIEEFNRFSCMRLKSHLEFVKNGAIELTYTDEESIKLKNIQSYVDKYKNLGLCSFKSKAPNK